MRSEKMCLRRTSAKKCSPGKKKEKKTNQNFVEHRATYSGWHVADWIKHIKSKDSKSHRTWCQLTEQKHQTAADHWSKIHWEITDMELRIISSPPPEHKRHLDCQVFSSLRPRYSISALAPFRFPLYLTSSRWNISLTSYKNYDEEK